MSIEFVGCPSHIKVEGCTLAIEKTAGAEKDGTHSPGSDYSTLGQYALAPHYNRGCATFNLHM
jgi:hypothetical protein